MLLARVFVLVCVLASSLACAAKQPVYKAEDLDRWLGENMKILTSPASEDAKKAHYVKAAAAGSIFAPLLLEGIARLRKENAQARKWARTNRANHVAAVLRELAASDMRAQALLGVAHDWGLAGAARDEAQATAWFRKAAEQGHAYAQNILGNRYAYGWGVAKDEALAAAWLRKAAEQGHAVAQTRLGGMYADGRGVDKDDAQAAAWFRKAAEQGHAGAQVNLSALYGLGQGVAKDEAQSAAWLRKAAEQGDAFAQFNLGNMYALGRGVVKDEAQAVEWWRKAAEQGHAQAKEFLERLSGR
jgi:TPR repeat protein